MATTNDSTQSAPTERPGTRDGVQTELLVIAPVKPGHAAALREVITGHQRESDRRQGVRELGTVHNYRSMLIDNDTRYLFASVFDGTWDDYIDDFGASPYFEAAFDAALHHTEGYTRWSDPGTKDWLVAAQVPAFQFTSAYPDLTVKQIWKLRRLNEAFQAVLDSPEFQAAVKNPAYAELLNTPAFQKLLDEAAG